MEHSDPDNFDAQLAALRRDMLKFAMLQLRDHATAEDAVQEAMAAAFSGQRQFTGRARLKTWVFGILKHKIVDIIRERMRFPCVATALEEIPENELCRRQSEVSSLRPNELCRRQSEVSSLRPSAYDDLFDEGGHWLADTKPSGWGDPESSFSNGRFWQVFEICLTRLPENTARVFMMREMLGFETAEICKELCITPTNCWVVLHRARMALRLCLDDRWFERKG